MGLQDTSLSARKDQGMDRLDMPPERNPNQSQTPPNERAVLAMLKPPALSYTRELRQAIDEDPNFLAFHDQSIGLKVQKFLSKEGIFWDEEVYEREVMKVVTEAVTRVRSLDKR